MDKIETTGSWRIWDDDTVPCVVLVVVWDNQFWVIDSKMNHEPVEDEQVKGSRFIAVADQELVKLTCSVIAIRGILGAMLK